MAQYSFDDLGLFFIVAEKGSFLEAANYTKKSHVTIQRRITAFEEALGKKLFIRSTTGVTKTAFANELIAKTKSSYNELNQYFKELEIDQSNKNNKPHPIKIFLSSGMSYFFLEFIYPGLMADEKIELEITTYTAKLIEFNIDQIKPLLNNYDCIFIEGEYQHLISDLRWSVISSREGAFQFFATESYLKKNPPIKTLDDLKNHNCLYLNQGFKNYIELLNKQTNAKKLIQLHGNFSSDIIEHLLDLTIRDYGIGLLPNFYINKTLKQPVITLLENYHGPEHQILCLKNSLSNNPIIDLFIKNLKDIIRKI